MFTVGDAAELAKEVVMPKRLVCVALGQLEWDEFEVPELGEGHVLVRAEFGAAKHGTEMAFFKGYGSYRGSYDEEYQVFVGKKEPETSFFAPIGNMIVGRVEDVGKGVESLAVGDQVCLYSGFQDMCVASAEHCWKMPEGMSWKSAVCIDPADFAFAAIRDGNARLGDAVAIFGLGAIGLMAVQLARVAGADTVIGIDPLANRREVAQQLGASAVLDPVAVGDVGLEIKKLTGKRGADVVIEYSGTMKAMQHALRGVAYGGNVVSGSFPPAYKEGLDFGAEGHMNIPNIIFTRACSQPGRDYPRWDESRIYDTCWKLLCEGAVTGDPIVQPVVPFDELLTEYPKIASNPESNVKLGIEL